MQVKLSALHNTNWVDREGDIEVRIVVRMNSMTGGGGGRRKSQMIGRNPKAGSGILFVRGNRKRKNSVFRTEVAVKRRANLMPKLRTKKQSSWIGDNRCLQAKLLRIAITCSLSLFNSKKEERKEKEKGHLYLILSAGNIAGTLNMCLCPHVLKTLLYFKCHPVSKLIRCVVCLSSCLLLHIPFQLHSLQFILAKCPIRL